MFELARVREKDALTAFRTAERQAERLVAPHGLATELRASLLRTLIRMGATQQAERAIAELGEKERETGEMRATVAALRLAEDDPLAAIAALEPVVNGSVPVINRLSSTEALPLEATARDALGDPSGAESALERALDPAEPDGAVLPFILRPVAGLLGQFRLMPRVLAVLLLGADTDSTMCAMPAHPALREAREERSATGHRPGSSPCSRAAPMPTPSTSSPAWRWPACAHADS